MGDTWMKLKPEDTCRTRTILVHGESFPDIEHEFCMICHNSNCTLVGKYGTCNEFGTFRGVCLECLSKLQKLGNIRSGNNSHDKKKLLSESIDREYFTKCPYCNAKLLHGKICTSCGYNTGVSTKSDKKDDFDKEDDFDEQNSKEFDYERR